MPWSVYPCNERNKRASETSVFKHRYKHRDLWHERAHLHRTHERELDAPQEVEIEFELEWQEEEVSQINSIVTEETPRSEILQQQEKTATFILTNYYFFPDM